MNGAESLVQTALDAGVRVCFSNPGTTELPLVSALDSVDGMRAVLGLFEGVCTGAADGYARMSGAPALALLHLGPGLSNGLANLHNACRARTPVVAVVGEHTTTHRGFDPPLATDIVGLAQPVSRWVRTTTSAKAVAGDTAEAIAAAREGGVATLIVPADCQWEAAEGPVPAQLSGGRSRTSPDRVARAARVLSSSESAVLFLGGSALGPSGVRAAGRVAAASGCRLICETFTARVERGSGLPPIERLPYFPEEAADLFASAEHVVRAGADDPVAFFGYPDKPSRLIPSEVPTTVLCEPLEDAVSALQELADALDAPDDPVISRPPRPEPPTGDLTAETVCQALAAVQPEGAIVVDEALTTGLSYFSVSAGAPPHTVLSVTGGAIGQGLPAAVGAAVACSDRPIIAFQADGSAMYTLQSLWTQAREGLNVTTLLCANHRYRILQLELDRSGSSELGAAARALTDLSDPRIDWPALAGSLGVPASRATTAEELVDRLEQALAEPGPHLVEAVL